MSHLPHEVFTRISSGELGRAEVAEILRHLGDCAGCRREARSVSFDADAVSRALHEPEEHLDFDAQMMPYLRGGLDPADLEIVESHLEDCAMCAGEIEDLRRTVAHPPASRWRAPLAVAAAVIVIVSLALLFTRRAGVRTPSPPVIATGIPAGPPPAPSPRESPKGEWQQLVDEALNRSRLPFPRDLDALRGRPDPLRGNGIDPRDVLAPAGVVVDDDRPRFTWPARERAVYTVLILEGDAPVERSGSLQTNQWRPDRALKRGRTYLWQVAVVRGDERVVLPAPPAAPARFRIVAPKDHDDLVRARKAGPIVHAVVAARAGLRDEALAALLAIGSSDPRVRKLQRAYSR